MSLPEHVRPAERVIAPTRIAPGYDLEAAPAAPLDLPDGAEVRIVEYRQYAGGLVPVYAVQQRVERTAPRDLSPEPLLDRQAQRMLAGGVGGGTLAAGVGYGAGQIFGGLAGLGTGGLFALALLLAAAKWSGKGRTTHLTVNQHAAGLFGRNHSSTTHNHR